MKSSTHLAVIGLTAVLLLVGFAGTLASLAASLTVGPPSDLDGPGAPLAQQSGDINGDGKVDILDVQLCVNVILGIETDPAIVQASDVNQDGVVNVLDVQETVNIFMSPPATPTPTNTPLTPTATHTWTNTPPPTATPSYTPTSTPPAPTPTPSGSVARWSKVELEFAGPTSLGMSDAQNPFKILVDVNFVAPVGKTYVVPAFYDGDGNGGLDGDVWKVRFSPDQAGTWTYTTSSSETLLNGHSGSFEVADPSGCSAYVAGGLPDFGCVGRLEHVGEHYLKFSDGPYWLKGGADEPESFLAPGVNAGFATKEQAIDYLASKGVNSIYLMLHNIDGDGKNVWPWVGSTQAEAKANHEHFDVAKLQEWEALFEYIQSKGLVLHLVFEDDSAWTGFNRQMYYREMIARFGHHNGLYWNISEEYNENYSSNQIKSFADIITALDAYDHPLTVHNQGSTSNWNPFLGNDRFDLTSLQTYPSAQNDEAVTWFEAVENSGHTIPTSFDETGQHSADQRDLTRHILWSIYLGGGNFELFTILGTTGYEAFAGHFEDMTRARTWIEELPFTEMRPRNDLLMSGTAYVFAEHGQAYIAYLPTAGSIQLDLTGATGSFTMRWINPASGATVSGGSISGGSVHTLSSPHSSDSVVILEHD